VNLKICGFVGLELENWLFKDMGIQGFEDFRGLGRLGIWASGDLRI
jgi:hypothetical protein